MMENLLKPDFFNTSNDTIKTMMSTVISATLPKTTNTKLTKPVNFTFRHIRVRDWNLFLPNLRTDEHLKTSNIQCLIFSSSVCRSLIPAALCPVCTGISASGL